VPEPAYTAVTNDLDMPAFMRRRDRYAARKHTPSFQYLEQDR
jgi:hypothetical protein